MFLRPLTTGALCPTRTTMVLMLVHLQGAAVIFRVGRHHHHGPFCEGRGLTHALTDTAPTDLTVSPRTHRWVPSHSPTVSCAYCAAGWRQPLAPYTHVLPRCPQARVPQLQPVGKQERSNCAIGLPQALVRKPQTPGSGTVPVVETGECGDVETRARPHSDATCLCRA